MNRLRRLLVNNLPQESTSGQAGTKSIFNYVRLVLAFVACFLLLPIGATISGVPLYSIPVYATNKNIDLSNTIGTADFPKLATSGTNAYAAWFFTPSSGPGQIFLSRSENFGGTFGPPLALTNSSSRFNTCGTEVNTSFPLAISAAKAPSNGGATSDNVYAAWSGQINDTQQVLYTRSVNGGNSFSTAVSLSNDSGSAALPSIVAPDDGSGNVYAVWVDNTINATSTGNFTVFFTKSTDGGTTFSKPVPISNDSIQSSCPEIAVSGNYVYIIWVGTTSDSITNIYGRSSSNGGSTFGSEVRISSGFPGSFENIAVKGNNAYVVWNGAQSVNRSQIYISNTTNGGVSFSAPYDVSNDTGITPALTTPQIAISKPDGNVYVVWPDASMSLPQPQIFEASINAGKIGKATDLSNSTGTTADPAIATSTTGNVYASWTDNRAGTNQIYSIQIASGGTRFNGPALVSNTSGNSSHSQIATAAASGADNVYIAWSDTSGGGTGGQDIFFTSNPNYNVPKISISQISNSSPNWGDPLTISGSLINAASNESVSVEWGDGSHPTTGLPVNVGSGTWGPASHAYNSSAIALNPNYIVAKLVNSTSGSIIAQSALSPITVKKHTSSLILDPIESVIQDSTVKVQGKLIDLNASGDPPISGKNVSFSGNGAAGLAPRITSVNGSFSSVAASPNQAGDGWSVFAAFAGDQTYLGSNSTATYNTAPTSARSTNVPLGSNVQVDLRTSGFNSSMTFDQVIAAGRIYVWGCVIQNSTSYITLHNLCVSAAPGFSMGANSLAHIKISFAGTAIPSPYTSSNIDIFKLDSPPSGKVIDITESRDPGSQTVTGSMSSFSSFIAAIALHASLPAGCNSKQIFTGNDPSANTVSFRSFSFPTISLDKSSYTVGSTATITVSDPNLVTDISKVETANATVTASSSPAKLQLELTETGPGTGVFTAQFGITSSSTSSTTRLLHVQPGDSIDASIESAKPSIRLVYNDVSASGIIGVCDYVIDQKSSFQTPFLTVGGALNVTAGDVQLVPGSLVNVTMSYGSDDIGSNPGTSIGIFQYQPGPGWVDITLSGQAGHDLTAKLVKGTTTFPSGLYALGFCPTGCPGSGSGIGGGGGGASLPGSGFVVDFVASTESGGINGGSGTGLGGGPSGGGGTSGGGTGGPGTDLTTYPADYFASNPLAKVKIYPVVLGANSSGQSSSQTSQTISLHAGQQMTISSQFKSYEETQQPYAFITLVTDSNGFTNEISWQIGSMAPGSGENLSSSWTPAEPGTYTIKTFVWDSISGAPLPLSQDQQMTVSVLS